MKSVSKDRLLALLSSLEGEKGFVDFIRIYSFKNVFSKFKTGDWLKMFPDYPSYFEADDFFKAKDFLYAFIFRSKNSGEEKGIIFIFIDNFDPPTISIHGGSWQKSLGNSRFIFNVYRYICNYFFNAGVKVHTSVNKQYTNVLRFNKRVGFKIYRYTNNFVLSRYFKRQDMI